MNEQKVTAKKIAADFIVLARDIGIYLVDVGKTVYGKIKCVLDSSKENNAAKVDQTAARTASE